MEATTTAVTMTEKTREGTDRRCDSERNRCVMKARQEKARYRTQSDHHVVAMVVAEVEAEMVAKKVTEEKEAAAAVVERETVTFMEARSGKQVMKRDKAVVFHDSTGPDTETEGHGDVAERW
jgi:septum formation inhibitor MinC